MPTLTIPDRYTDGLAKIMSLSAEQVGAVVLALQHANIGTQREMATLLVGALPDFQPDAIKAIAGALRSLYAVRTSMDLSLEDFVGSLVSAIHQNDQLKPEDASGLSGLEKTLPELLGVHPLTVLSKARDLRVDFQNTFCDSRVITDMRPVFDAEVKQDPIGFVLTHTLKLEYHDQGGEHVKIHIALDKDDIDQLSLVLRRAKDKAETLSRVAAKSGLKILSQ